MTLTRKLDMIKRAIDGYSGHDVETVEVRLRGLRDIKALCDIEIKRITPKRTLIQRIFN